MQDDTAMLITGAWVAKDYVMITSVYGVHVMTLEDWNEMVEETTI